MALPNTKPAGSSENVGKSRHNIVLEADTRTRSEKLMELEKRSFNNLVEVLIDREFERQACLKPELHEVAV